MGSYFAGIDLGGTNIKAGVVDQAGNVLAKVSVSTEADEGPDHVVKRMCQAAEAAIGKSGLAVQDILAVGIGAPGALSHRDGVIIKPPNLPGWSNVPVRDLVGRHLGLPATLENDGNAAAWGEFWVGAGRDAHSLVMFTLGTGIGGGIVHGGEFIRGHFDNGAEIGHVVVEPSGRQCPCGQQGCLEAYASAASTARIARQAIEAGGVSTMKQVLDDGGEITSELIVEHMVNGDKLADEVWQQTCRYLAIGCINMAHVINPQLLVLSGGMVYAGERLLDPVRRYYEQLRGPVFGQTYGEIVLAELGNDAGFIGAAGAAKLAEETGDLNG